MPEDIPPSDSAENSNQSVSEEELHHGYGFDLYPERRKAREYNFLANLFTMESRDNIEQYRCEKNVVQVIKQSPMVRIMLSALEKAGCPINFRRHINCEYCEPVVTGGYDPLLNQVVICHNMVRSFGVTESVIYHELIHMFDYCTGNLDFKNVDHIACTEIRAANLTYCNYLPAVIQGMIPRNKLKLQHQECVKKRAIDSVLACRPVSYEEAVASVNKVFKRCYADMEPIGRQMKGKPINGDLAYSEAFLLGYD